MLQKLLQNILNKPKLVYVLKVVGWTFVIVSIIITNIMMKDQEISFVYNNF